MENNICKILWDFIVQTDHDIYRRIPYVIVLQEDKNLCQIIDFACAYDRRVDTKELEKKKHYQDLAQELKKIWNKKVKVIPLVIGTLGTTLRKLRKWLKELGIETQTTELQKTILIHIAQILQKVLEIYRNLLLLDLQNINPLLKQCYVIS